MLLVCCTVRRRAALQKPQAWANVALLFDYRCYVPGGKIGKDWPAPVQQCLNKLHGMTTEEIQVRACTAAHALPGSARRCAFACGWR